MSADDLGLRFECTKCGKCCTFRDEYAHVYVSRAEVKALAEHLELELRAFRRRYTFTDEYGWTQLRTTGERCVFLDADTGRCLVYPVRPTQCRTFPFWRELVEDDAWTEEAARVCEGVGRGRLYAPEEVLARMLEHEAVEDD